MPRGLLFLADALIVIRQNLVRGPVARFLLQCTIQPAQAFVRLAAVQEDYPRLMAKSGIVGRFHDPPRHFPEAAELRFNLPKLSLICRRGFGLAALLEAEVQ